jgi:Fe-S cluster assembly protein SufD
LDDRARGVFTGRVVVAKGADGTDAKQVNNSLLLSDRAVANTRPQLEIYADDVKCSHGATVGQLDDEALFYLAARGLGPSQAQALLTYGFAGEVLDTVSIAPLREALQTRVRAWLEGASL